MQALLKRLQAQSSYAHKSQQPLSLHGYKEFELQAHLLGPGALQDLFLD